MTLPPLHLHPLSTSHYYTSGDVTVDASAAIAPGVLLQADPDSRVVIRAGACIGIGAILHAHAGIVEVGEGSNIGAEALLIGRVTIGRRACIGAASTLLNCAIAPGELVPAGSLIGDASRSPSELSASEPPAPELHTTETVILPPDAPTPPAPALSDAQDNQRPSESTGMNVYGQVYVNQLLVKMFPNSHKSGDAPVVEPPAALKDDPWDD